MTSLGGTLAMSAACRLVFAKPEDGADVVVLRHAVEHDRDRPPRPGKKLVTGKFGVAQLRRGQRPAHIRASNGSTDCQYSSANMIVITRSVTVWSEGSGEWKLRDLSK